MIDGLAKSYDWYVANKEKIQRKNYINYIDEKYLNTKI